MLGFKGLIKQFERLFLCFTQFGDSSRFWQISPKAP